MIVKKLKNIWKQYIVRDRIIPVQVPVYEFGDIFSGKTAVVTGGSSGIGLGVSKALAKSGCKVYITGRDGQKIELISKEIGCDFLVLDVCNTKMISDVISNFPHNIDMLINSAGYHGKDEFGSVSESCWDAVIDTNVKGLYFISQAVANHMKERGVRGNILNISSASALKPGWTPYEISKHAVNSITVGMADKLINYGIVVNGIAPGPVATPMMGRNDEHEMDLTWKANPSGRMLTVGEVVNLALFMLSDMGRAMVGTTAYITGGSGTISWK